MLHIPPLEVRAFSFQSQAHLGPLETNHMPENQENQPLSDNHARLRENQENQLV